ncbi:MAG: aminotransferase class I/II-fold pyridoxal phosphate-dependent enzyme [Candidatus Aminicenantes bacterium]|nr:aminotransferase class I/II-fold pyridoxal phosphate-dependent enzyme [Candidatus Aminicenantes bacterium]
MSAQPCPCPSDRPSAYRVLVMTPKPKDLKGELRELRSRGFKAVGVGTWEEAETELRRDGGIHAVLTEWRLPLARKSAELVEGVDLFKRILALRFEVNIFLFTAERDCTLFSAGGYTNSYFYKPDQDYDDIAKKIQAEIISSKDRAPFFDKLREYALQARDAWHTPGHSGGDSVKNSLSAGEFYRFFGPHLFQSDLSVSVPELDSLLDPKGVIKEAQDLAARAFNARYTYFSTNGTSTANKVLIQTLLKPGEAILLDRNCHKSVHYGVVIAGAEPIYLKPSINNKYGIFGPVPKAAIIRAMDQALAAGKKVKALILTNCTYDGLMYDIKAVVEEAHRRGIKVIVDEAWFGYAGFHPAFYPSAMAAGADYATQSTHKTMSAFSQASMIHVQDPDFERIEGFFRENFNMHASTSPQYPMIASLDVARRQMAMEGFGMLQRILDLSDSLRRSINSLEKFRILGLEDLVADEVRGDNIRLDRTKLTIDVSGSGYDSHEIEHILLNKHNIQIEKSTFNTLTVLITIGATTSKLNRLFIALENIERLSGSRREADSVKALREFRLELSPIKYRPRFAFYCDGEKIPLRDAAGRVATAMVVPYPPGIPLLVPGQLVSREIVDALMAYRDYGVEIHGLHDGLLSVITADEERELSGQGHKISDNCFA